jgi:hypothetical protein
MAQEAANILEGIKLYEKVVSILQSDEPLAWGRVMGEDTDYMVPDELRAGLMRHFRKNLEFQLDRLQKL